MPTPKESADLLLRLYELRREPVMRQARAWFITEFNPTSFEEIGRAVSGEKSAWLSMVVSYWGRRTKERVRRACAPDGPSSAF